MQRRPDAWGGSQTRPDLFKMKWITILFVLFIILIIILADRGQLGLLKLVNRIPYGDKAGHFILYGILTLLIDLMLFRSLPLRSPKRVALISGLILALLIGLEEFSQQYFDSRTFSLQDLVASYLGVIFFSWLALRNKK
ncbi:MAG TPA: VanZ family protein [Anaerolineales bacterium]|nr:VanZ family protein [Anaerolineales bacterium]